MDKTGQKWTKMNKMQQNLGKMCENMQKQEKWETNVRKWAKIEENGQNEQMGHNGTRIGRNVRICTKNRNNQRHNFKKMKKKI